MLFYSTGRNKTANTLPSGCTHVIFPCIHGFSMFHFQFWGWPYLFLTLAVQETEKDYNYTFGSKLIMNNEPPALDL